MQIYQIGGSVRDFIMGVKPHDLDFVVVGASIKKMQELGFQQVGKDFPVFLHPQTKDEYALARKEIKIGNKHNDFKFIFTPDTTLEDDVQRRDFTCNALALDNQSGKIIDLVGGTQDIKHKILRHINSAHFGEDPLRVLRMCRFSAQLNFEIALETMQIAQNMVKDNMLQHLSKQRIWNEFERALNTPYFDKFVIAMRDCGALEKILPEVNNLWNIPERTDFHPEGNTGMHTLLTLQASQYENAKIKFALFLHDVGKNYTPANILPHHYNHEKNGLPLIEKICSQIGAPKEYCKFALLACKNHMRFPLTTQMRLPKIFDMIDDITHFKNWQNLEDVAQVCRADILGRAGDIPPQRIANLELCIKKCKKIYETANCYKVQDIPNYNELPKNKQLAQKLREFQLSKIKQTGL